MKEGKKVSARKPISTKTRFEVFKRDKFKCHYCSRTPPEVVLNVDHIVPVAKGGKNNMLNLITACFDCNNGKRAILLSDDSVITAQKNQLDLLQDKKEQLKMMMDWYTGLLDIESDQGVLLRKYWSELAPGRNITETGLKILKRLISKYSLDEVLSAMKTSTAHYLEYDEGSNTVTQDSCEIAFNKIAGVCALNKADKEEPDLKELFYIRGILRNRIRYHDPQLTISWLKSARTWGVSIESLKQIALTVKTWSEFSDQIDLIIEEHKQ